MFYTKTKPMAIAIAIIFLSSIAIPLITPPSYAADTMVTYAFCGVVPGQTGVGQAVTLHVGITHQTAHPQEGWVGLSVTVTKPDNTTETMSGINTDTTGGTGISYVPTMTGTYYFQTHFPSQILRVGGIAFSTAPANTTMQASDSEKTPLIVNEEPIPYYPVQPLPNEYWTRPIDSQLREWSSIAGNWLNGQNGQSGIAGLRQRIALSNDAPETAHILWSKPLEIGNGGLVGGTEQYDGHGYYTGDAYEGKFSSPIIIAGVLYYNRYDIRVIAGLSNEIVALDLHTGKELWVKNLNNETLSFGQILHWEAPNGHGSYSMLWTVTGSTWNAYEAGSGRWMFRMTNVPSGTNYYDENGVILKYSISGGRLLRWNSTWAVKYWDQNLSATVTVYSPYSFVAGHSRLIGTTFSAANGYDLNVTIPAGLTGSILYAYDDRIIGSNLGATQTRVWGLSLKRGTEGTLLFDKTWNNPTQWITGNETLAWEAVSMEKDVGTIWSKEPRQHWGVSFETGDLLWGPTPSQDYRDTYYLTGSLIAYGNLYSSGVAGTLYCYDVKTGKTKWTYSATDPLVEFKLSPNYWLYIVFASEGKLYVGHYEHSSGDPKPRGAPFLCFNATTGDVIWKIDGAFRQTQWGGAGIIGDSIIATMDTYDQKVYAIGKGPSATTVSIKDDVITQGSSVLMKGMVTDISPGTTDSVLAMRFPDGVPAVSDASMSDWMLYVYKQFSLPTNAAGVEVTLSVLDANNNFREIGRTTSDAKGFYSFQWKPDIPGKYTVYASFAGTKSYWPSSSETSFAVDPAAATTAPTATTASNLATTTDIMLYIVGATVAIIIAIAIVGLMLLRKHP